MKGDVGLDHGAMTARPRWSAAPPRTRGARRLDKDESDLKRFTNAAL